MIKLHTLDNKAIYLNFLYMESFTSQSEVETLIRLRGGKTYVVKESPEEIMQAIEDYNRMQSAGWGVNVLHCEDAL
jgi:uncharacterized protein YlzI (FlbEa/FlbD family)